MGEERARQRETKRDQTARPGAVLNAYTLDNVEWT